MVRNTRYVLVSLINEDRPGVLKYTCVIYREGYLIDLWRENKKEREEVEKNKNRR